MDGPGPFVLLREGTACSFCGRAGDVAGTQAVTTALCRECAWIMIEVVRDFLRGSGPPSPPRTLSPAMQARLDAALDEFTCSFCGGRRDEVCRLFPAPGYRTTVCDGCVVLVLRLFED